MFCRAIQMDITCFYHNVLAIKLAVSPTADLQNYEAKQALVEWAEAARAPAGVCCRRASARRACTVEQDNCPFFKRFEIEMPVHQKTGWQPDDLHVEARFRVISNRLHLDHAGMRAFEHLNLSHRPRLLRRGAASPSQGEEVIR